MADALRTKFEQWKRRPDVVLWIKHSSRHAFRIWSDGYRKGFVDAAAGVPASSNDQQKGGA